MPKITDIYNFIKHSDLEPSRFEGLAYGITNNDCLGLPGGHPFTVLAPSTPFGEAAFNNLKVDVQGKPAPIVAGKMPIQETFKAVLTKGYDLSKDQTTLFIDIADLDDDDTGNPKNSGNTVFFTEGDDEKRSVAEAIATLVNNVPANVKPVIRFLRGASTTNNLNDGTFWEIRRPGIEAIFWKNEGGQLVPRITHPSAELHIGYYSPNFELSWLEEKLIRLVAGGFAFCRLGFSLYVRLSYIFRERLPHRQ